MNRPTCAQCRFFHLANATADLGECRHQSPQPGRARWPVVEPTDWCGRHKPTQYGPRGLNPAKAEEQLELPLDD